jgi:glycosidase
VFGTLAGFDGLLAAAHARRLRVLAGLGPDHTSTGTRGSFEPGQPAAGLVREG